MPEPALCGVGQPADSANCPSRRRPRPRPRLSLVSANTLNIPPPYENVWRDDIETAKLHLHHPKDKDTDGDCNELETGHVMATSSYQGPKLSSARAASSGRAHRATVSITPSTNSSIPVPQGCLQKQAAIKTSQLQPINSPRLVRGDKAAAACHQLNGHARTIMAPKVTTSTLRSQVELRQKTLKKVPSSQLVRRVTLKQNNCASKSADSQQLTTRSMETLPLAASANAKEMDRKSEYRKSVSIPPHLVAHLTSKFNALSEKCHQPLNNVDISATPSTPPVPNGVNGVLLAKTKAAHDDVVQPCARGTSAPVSSKTIRPISTTRTSSPMTQQAIIPSNSVSPLKAGRSEGLNHPASWIKRSMTHRHSHQHQQQSESEIHAATDVYDEVPPNALEVADDESRLTIGVKQAIRNYEVAFLKSSTSSPELLQRTRLSFAKCDDRAGSNDVAATSAGAGLINSQRSQTLPCTATTYNVVRPTTSTMDQGKPPAGVTCSTLPNIPYRAMGLAPATLTSLLPRAVGRIARDGSGSQSAASIANSSAGYPPSGINVSSARTSTTSETTSNGPSKSNCAMKITDLLCNKSELFRAKPAMAVVEEPKVRAGCSDPSKLSEGTWRSGRKPSLCRVDNKEVGSRSSSVDRTEIRSMDLLAEIESHPSLLQMSAKKKASSMSSASSSSSSSVAPNLSFLWKESTQTFVQSKVAAYGSSSSVDSGRSASAAAAKGSSGRPSIDNEEEEEPLYEELFNFASHSHLVCKRPAMELPATDIPIEDFSTSSDDSSVGGEGMMTYYLRSQEMAAAVEEEEEEDIEKGEDNESWTDYSDSDDGQSNTLNSACAAKLRSKIGKRRRNGRTLMRRSWSQSLRDLANVDRNEGMSQQECVNDIVAAAGWEEALSSDGSVENADAKLPSDDATLKKSDEAAEVDKEGQDKSQMTSIVTEETIEIQETRKTSSKERKVKKVKRNWTWSRAEFKLDISSKFEKIRLTSKKSHRSTTQADVTASSISVDPLLSPSKKSKQWSLKAKFAQMKSHGGSGSSDVKGERSPNSCTQFYVPTYNEDGTLATSPCSDAAAESPKSETESGSVSVEVIPVNHEGISSSREGSSRRLRRVSSGAAGMVARPKTAPPAPPTANKSSSSPSPGQTLSDNAASSDIGYGSQTWSSGSLNHEPVQRFHTDAKQTRSLKSDVIMTNANCNLRQRISVTSESSSETCAATDNTNVLNGQSAKEVANVSPTQLSDRDSRISQLELPPLFPPDVSRLSCKLSPFNDEPLYQFYNAAARLRAAHENQVAEDDDGRDLDSPSPYYESIYQMQNGKNSKPEVEGDEQEVGPNENEGDEEECSLFRKTTAMELVRSTSGGTRTLWCEVPEVRSSGVLDALPMQKRKLQEAMFEVITSEASYLKSLNVLVDCFVHCPLLSDDYSVNCVLSRREGHVLFSDVLPVRETSERLLADLERRWQESIVISDICDIILEHATKHFEVYVKYCSNQLYQDRCLKKLKETNPAFVEVVRKLEMSPSCQLLSMHSFLMLPMQRITRLPLLLDAIFQRLEYGTEQYDTCKQALATLNKIVHECNEGAHRMERMEEMLNISRQLDFRDCRCLPLISASRWLVKRGELTRLVFGDSSSKLSFGRRCARHSVYLFLFTDLLIVTKKKSDDCYNVVDYCPRNLVQATEIESPEQLPGRTNDGCRNIFQLSMLQNHDNRTVEMFFSCPKESDLTRWVEAVTPRKSENPDERIYEEWDCPQVQVLHSYVAQQPDELPLEESDVVNVFRKMADGWFQGERIRDGVQGWFPSNFTVEIVSSHIRARNLRQRYRLLALSHSYVENQRKKELSKTK